MVPVHNHVIVWDAHAAWPLEPPTAQDSVYVDPPILGVPQILVMVYYNTIITLINIFGTKRVTIPGNAEPPFDNY